MGEMALRVFFWICVGTLIIQLLKCALVFMQEALYPFVYGLGVIPHRNSEHIHPVPFTEQKNKQIPAK